MRIYDISVGISSDLPVWPGDPPIDLRRVQSIDDGAEANVSSLKAGVHIGTHIDAPLHFLSDGQSVDELPLRSLMGRAYVVDMGDIDSIDAESLDVAGIPPRTRRVLFRTRNSALWTAGGAFREDYVAVEPSAAEWLVRKGVRLVGVDYLSVAPYSDSGPTHRTLLEAGVVVVEGLNLIDVSKGRYTIYCLPIKLIGSEGAPARAVLVGV